MRITRSFSIPWRAYLELCKPKVVALMLMTAVVGMFLASSGWVPATILVLGNLGIGLTAASGAVINHLLDRQIDAIMHRTQNRPIVIGTVSPKKAGLFATLLAVFGLSILWFYTNPLTTYMTFASFLGYAVFYTVFLKRATPQNIVIGGLAGAAPPMLGYIAVTGQLDYIALLLVLIIFTWTPPHFWSLAIYRVRDYAQAKIPMLPVTHGITVTKRNILAYTILMILISLLPVLVAVCGFIYLIAVLCLDAVFLYWAIKLQYSPDPKVAIYTFSYSIIYLLLLFVALLVDHHVLFLV